MTADEEKTILILDDNDKKMLSLMKQARNEDGSIDWEKLERLIEKSAPKDAQPK